MKRKHALAHMKAAFVYAELSYCKRRQVGCVIVKNDTPIAIGYNGTPSGEENCCEDEEGKTKPNVAHAEDNALRKLVRSSESSEGAVLFVTSEVCKRCAEKITDARISKVYYASESPNVHGGGSGLDHLRKHDVEVELLEVQ